MNRKIVLFFIWIYCGMLILSACSPAGSEKIPPDNRMDDNKTPTVEIKKIPVDTETITLKKTSLPTATPDNIVFAPDRPLKINDFDPKHWTFIEEKQMGLSFALIFDIGFGLDHSIWFGSNQGIAHLNGKNRTTYSKAEGIPIGFPLLVDKKGNLWTYTMDVSERDSKLAMFNGKKWSFYDIPIRAWFFVEDKNGIIWFVEREYQSYIMSFDGTTFTKHFINNRSDLDIDDLAFDSRGDLWCATDEGLFHYNGKDWVQISLEKLSGQTSKIGLMKLVITSDDTIWLVINHSLIKYKDGVSTIYQNQSLNEITTVNSLFMDSSGNLWIGGQDDYGRTIIKYNQKEWDVFTTYPLGVYKIAQAPDGSMWFGVAGGAYRYQP